MILLRELQESVQYITEATESGKKNLYIEGCFMVHSQQNKNGRLYPSSVMEQAVNRYTKEIINERRGYGELNHPPGPQINLDRVSHLIEKLEFKNDGSVWGRAKILDTPMGNIARGLIEGGANIGVSSRGLGSVKQIDGGLMEVQNDYRLVTAADIVADPSAPGAFVKGIAEDVQYFFCEQTGEYVEDIKKQIKTLSQDQLEEQKFVLFKQFLKTL